MPQLECEPDLRRVRRLAVLLLEGRRVRRLPLHCTCFSFVCTSHLHVPRKRGPLFPSSGLGQVSSSGNFLEMIPSNLKPGNSGEPTSKTWSVACPQFCSLPHFRLTNPNPRSIHANPL